MSLDQRLPVASLRRLRLAGLLVPLVFVVVMLVLRPILIATVGLDAAHLTLGTTLLLSATAFGVAMYHLLGKAYEAAAETERRTAALLERERIARELHDSLAQVLGVTHLRLHALSVRASVGADECAHREVLDLADLCHEAYADVREAILALKGSNRPDRTLLEHLRSYVATFSRTSGVPTTLVADTDADLCLAPGAEIQVVRIIQEALTNVRKHAGATAATVSVIAGAHHVECVVSDDGVGFDTASAQAGDGFGFTSMRERAESAGGRLLLESAPGAGTRVSVSVPGRTLATRPTGALA